MSTLIVAFPKIEEARAVRSLLVRKGYDVAVPCTSGAQVINQADALSDGIIISGVSPRISVVAVIFTNRSPLSVAHIRPPFFPVVVGHSLSFSCHNSNFSCEIMK